VVKVLQPNPSLLVFFLQAFSSQLQVPP